MRDQQIALELANARSGADYVRSQIERMESSGNADRNPYMRVLLKQYLPPFLEELKLVLAQSTEAAKAMRQISPETIAYYSIVSTVATLLVNEVTTPQALASLLARETYSEIYTKGLSELSPDLYYIITRGLDSRRSRDNEHRYKVYRSEAKRQGLHEALPLWPTDFRLKIGMRLVYILESIGLIEVTERVKKVSDVFLATEVLILVDRLTDIVASSSVVATPMVCKPIQWESAYDGGFLTQEMRRAYPSIMLSYPVVKQAIPERVLSAINSIQSTAWRVNRKLHDALVAMQPEVNLASIVAQGLTPKPERPAHIPLTATKDTMTEEQAQELVRWKRDVAQWYTATIQHQRTSLKLATIMKDAQVYKEYPKIYFATFIDSRYRIYTMSRSINPQGADLAKALCEFADGCDLDSQEAIDWFMIHGANKFGYDKAPLADRIQWVKDNDLLIRRIAHHPARETWWQDADKPFQFLAWCLEYAHWRESPATFKSHLPIAVDGSCNGLQHYSAMLRDEVGGAATNLVPADKQSDIYQAVADEVTRLLKAWREEDDNLVTFKHRWLEHGINRSVVKRCVMTLPYGSTRIAHVDFIRDDYLAAGKCPQFSTGEYHKAAHYLGYFVWQAIGNVVVKAREAMAWLQTAAIEVLKKSGGAKLEWHNPIGAVIEQEYWATKTKRVDSYRDPKRKIFVQTCYTVKADKVDGRRMKDGIAPNMIHSCDCAHLMLTVNALRAKGVRNFAMIHDDFGVPANQIGLLNRVLRDCFVTMYESFDPLEAFYQRYKEFISEPPPSKGSLDLSLVKSSLYMFA